tara:strand:- start:30 stop:422 length:393 start_codon:yes stop_codon:yes gene_type:complete
MTQPKYTQETISEIEDFFQSNFNQTSINRVQSGDSEGQLYVSYRYLNPEQKKILEDFSVNKLGNSFKVVQTQINSRVRKGNLFLGKQEEQKPKATNESMTKNVIVKCSQLVRENKMSHSDMCEIIDNLYS